MAYYQGEDAEQFDKGWGRTREEAVLDLIVECPRPRGYPDCFDKDKPFTAYLYREAERARKERLRICLDGWIEWQRQEAA